MKIEWFVALLNIIGTEDSSIYHPLNATVDGR